MTALDPGTRINSWVIGESIVSGEGYQDYVVQHAFLGFEAELRVFGPEFGESPETITTLRRFISHFGTSTHPALRSVLDTGDVSRWTKGSDFVVLDKVRSPSLDVTSRESPLDTRERILPFLQALAALLVDAQGLRFGTDRLGLRDLSWDGGCFYAYGVAWGVLFDGFLRRRLSALADRWEHDFSTGVYPLGEKSFPRVDSIVRVGHLAYGAAGILQPDKRILDAAKVSSAETSATAPPLVEGWGLAVEAVVRRCLFAHQSGVIDKPEVLLDAVEKLIVGETPEAGSALPSLTVESVTTRASEREQEGETGYGDEDSQFIPSGEGPSPTRAFTPLGSEAAVLDAPTKKAAKRVKAAKKGKIPKAARGPRRAMAPEKKALLVKIAAAVAGVVIIVLLLVVFVGGRTKPNVAPTAAMGSVPMTAKLLESIPLDASASFDPDGNPLSYEWSIPDLGPVDYELRPNDTAAAVKATVKFFKVGNHTIVLRVFDGHLYSKRVQATIDVGE